MELSVCARNMTLDAAYYSVLLSH